MIKLEQFRFFKVKTIKGRIFGWSFFSASILLISICLGIYFQVRNTIFDSMDHILHSNMQMITGLIEIEGEIIDLELSEPVYGEYSIPLSGHYYKLIIHQKETKVIISPSIINKDFEFKELKKISGNREKGEKIFISTGPDGEFLRVLHKKFLAFDTPVDLYIAESMSENLSLLEKIRTFLIITVPLTVFFIGIASFIIALRALKPLEEFSENVKQITHKNLNTKIQLADPIAELDNLKESFNNMLERIKKAFDLEKMIVSEASHQLKTPLAVIKSHCDIILLKNRNTDDYKETLQTIKETSENMARLINDMLLLARLDSGLLTNNDFQQISLKECLINTIRIAEPIGDRKQVRLISEIPNDIIVSGNKEKLTEAFLNIVENGIKYNSENGFVKVSLKADGIYADIIFEDSGIGINESDLEKIFERFYRSESNSDTEGTGLGLSIVKTIIDIHGGNIATKSEGNGSLFIVKLPISGNRH